MNILNKLFSNKEIKEIKLPIISEMVDRFKHFLPTNKKEENYLNEYRNWVFACVNARAEELASIDLYLENTKTDEEIENHEILNLLNDVNPNMTRYELFFGTQAFLDLVGNAYWYLARDGKKIKQIYLISPEKMFISLSKENPLEIAGYVYSNGKEKVPFEKEEILHFKNFNPKGGYPNPHKGIGIVESALWSIETDNEARNWNYSFFKNSAKPDGVLTTETSLTDIQFEKVKQSWQQAHQGSDKNGKTAILENGLKWQDISKTQKDMDFLGQRTFSRDEILALFRVPRTVIGITDDVNRANAEASDYVFAKRTVEPIMKKFVNVLNEYLLTEYDPSGNLKFRFETPVPEDRNLELQEYSLGINKWLTRNDIRREEGLIPAENGDVFYGSFSDVPQDSVPQAKTIKNPQAQSKIEKTVDSFVARLPKRNKEYKRLSEGQKSVYKDVWNKRFDQNEKLLIKDVKEYFNKQEQEVLKNLQDEFKGLKSAEYQYKAVEDIVFDKEKAVGGAISLITPHIRKFLKEGGEIAESYVDSELNMNDPNVIKFIQDRAKFFGESINDTTA
jgi:HK97 family phage portal protein